MHTTEHFQCDENWTKRNQLTISQAIYLLLIGIDKLSPYVSGQHVDYDNLTPLFNIDQ